jgi:hypothetical protein
LGTRQSPDRRIRGRPVLKVLAVRAGALTLSTDRSAIRRTRGWLVLKVERRAVKVRRRYCVGRVGGLLRFSVGCLFLPMLYVGGVRHRGGGL